MCRPPSWRGGQQQGETWWSTADRELFGRSSRFGSLQGSGGDPSSLLALPLPWDRRRTPSWPLNILTPKTIFICLTYTYTLNQNCFIILHWWPYTWTLIKGLIGVSMLNRPVLTRTWALVSSPHIKSCEDEPWRVPFVFVQLSLICWAWTIRTLTAALSAFYLPFMLPHFWYDLRAFILLIVFLSLVVVFIIFIVLKLCALCHCCLMFLLI